MFEANFNIIFWVILGLFTLSAAIMATSTIINIVRLRNVRLSWKAGKMCGYPLFSTLFLISTGIVGGITFYRGSGEEMIVAGLYSWLGLCWFTTSYFTTKRFITDHGIVKNVNEPSQTVAWHEIWDFVEKEEAAQTHYIFLYKSDGRTEENKLVRLELDIPKKQKKSFQKLISHKLGRRIRCYIDEDVNLRQFDKL